ncbi:MAG: hypothetical protein FVQ77_10435 [Cytophagales bacterium]|nr:hypothetical protein [Cytophagales bacterium]
MNVELAQKLSKATFDKSQTLFIGAGVLGSKIISHFGRSGNINLTVIDNDSLEPHNLIRHILFYEDVGNNKAQAVVKKIKNFYRFDSPKNIVVHDINALDLEKQITFEHFWVVDTTASLQVQNLLCTSDIFDRNNVCKAEVADEGNIGLLYIEGKQRNPRVDDLIYLTYLKGKKYNFISKWLKKEKHKRTGEEYDVVDVGLGCSSATLVASDDLISTHAAFFSRIIKREWNRENIGKCGLIFINHISEKELVTGCTINEKVNPFTVLKCENKSGWKIRVKYEVAQLIYKQVKKAGKKETGGVFIGIANYKTRTIHVLDHIDAPPDSKRAESCFIRGINKLPEQVNMIKKITGNLIGYVGEWHSHSMGLEELSGVDIEAVKKLKPLNDEIPIPTFFLIIANGKLLPFVFE